MNGNEFRLIMLLCSAVYATTPDEDKGQFKNSNSVTLNGRGQLTNVRGGGSACSLKKKKTFNVIIQSYTFEKCLKKECLLFKTQAIDLIRGYLICSSFLMFTTSLQFQTQLLKFKKIKLILQDQTAYEAAGVAFELEVALHASTLFLHNWAPLNWICTLPFSIQAWWN